LYSQWLPRQLRSQHGTGVRDRIVRQLCWLHRTYSKRFRRHQFFLEHGSNGQEYDHNFSQLGDYFGVFICDFVYHISKQDVEI
jgi:hypothetical protein